MSRRARYDAPKRALDVAAALVGLAVTLPVQLIVAVIVRTRMGSPVLFRHERPGRDGIAFTLLKFRTMKPIDVDRGITSDEQRLTRLGRVLRSTSIDELPSLVNVLKGDMSIVGPRPLHVRYLERYTPEQARRHEVRPGITGLAQVRGRNLLDWEERFKADVEYVERRSLGLDARIVAATIRLVVTGHGVSAEQHATSPEFFPPNPRGSVTDGD